MASSDSDFERRVQLLVVLARAVAGEIKTLTADLSADRMKSQVSPINLALKGIDFYKEVQQFEIELLRTALDHCKGNQSRAARLLRMRATTLHAKVKHYGLNRT